MHVVVCAGDRRDADAGSCSSVVRSWCLQLSKTGFWQFWTFEYPMEHLQRVNESVIFSIINTSYLRVIIIISDLF